MAKSNGKSAAAKVAAAANSDALKSSVDFFLDDLPKTLFPLHTNRILIEHGKAEIEEYIAKCLDKSDIAYGFIPQQRVYASKSGGYLRRTVKLDAVSEYFIYDLVWRNKGRFRKPHENHKSHYGYRIESGIPITATNAYRGFKGAIAEYSAKYAHSLGVDVASYFNNIYHHDLVSWFGEIGAEEHDTESFGQFLREINSGRSLDCLPQGLYPTKMVGNDFLRFVDNHHAIESDRLVRFMDDIHIFSDSDVAIENDFQTIQQLLGSRGLSVNPRKTTTNSATSTQLEEEIDAVKAMLLARRRMMVVAGYDDAGDEIQEEITVKWPLSQKEIDYIEKILALPDIDEEDAELILTIMRKHAIKVESRLPYIIEKFPHLSKNVFSFCAYVKDKESLADMLINRLKDPNQIQEYQLFWFAAMLESYLMATSKTSSLISLLLKHRSATGISKSRVLEIRDTRFGLQDARDTHLLSGTTDWLSWASAIGSTSLKPTSRNHKLTYFGKASNMNNLIAAIVMKI